MQRGLVMAALLSGCDLVYGLSGRTTAVDASPDVFTVDPVAGTPFSTPIPITELQSAAEEDDPSLTGDLRELYFLSTGDIYLSIRADTASPWSARSLVMPIDDTLTNFRPSISSDGLSLYFTRRNPIAPLDDIYVATRANRNAPWEPPVILPGDVNTNDNEIGGWTSDDGLTLLVEHHAPGGQHDLYFATRESTSEPFTRGAPLDFVNTSANEGGGWFNAERTILFFDSNRIGSSTSIWEAYFDGEKWVVIAHPELDSPFSDGTPWISPDARTIVFSTTRSGTNDDLYIATR